MSFRFLRDAFWSTCANPACPRCVPASGQPSPGTIHSISSATNANTRCLSPLPIAAKKSFTTWTFFSILIEISPFPLHRIVSDLIKRIRSRRSLLFFEQILEDQPPQVLPRACTSAPPSLNFPSLTGANPSCLAKSDTGAIASSSSLDRKTTRWPPSTTGSVARTGRNQMIETFHDLSASERPRNEGGGRRPRPVPQVELGNEFMASMDRLAFPTRQGLRNLAVLPERTASRIVSALIASAATGVTVGPIARACGASSSGDRRLPTMTSMSYEQRPGEVVANLAEPTIAQPICSPVVYRPLRPADKRMACCSEWVRPRQTAVDGELAGSHEAAVARREKAAAAPISAGSAMALERSHRGVGFLALFAERCLRESVAVAPGTARSPGCRCPSGPPPRSARGRALPLCSAL